MTKLISVTITPLNWACCFHLQERLSSYFTFSFLQYSREGSYGLEEFHDDSEQACAKWCNRYTSCKEAIINFEKYSAKQSSIFRAPSNWIFFCRGGKESDWENNRDLWEKFSYSFFLCFFHCHSSLYHLKLIAKILCKEFNDRADHRPVIFLVNMKIQNCTTGKSCRDILQSHDYAVERRGNNQSNASLFNVWTTAVDKIPFSQVYLDTKIDQLASLD